MNLPSGDLEPYARGKIEELRANYIEQPGRQRIRFSSDILGVAKWEEMIRLTQTTGHEHGIGLQRGWGNRVMQSRIEEGREDNKDFMNMVVGLKGLLAPDRGNVVVHTHYMNPESHLRTHFFTDGDIKTFIERTNLHGFAMLDRGGAHLLVRTRASYPGETLRFPPEDLVEQVKQGVIDRKGRTRDIVKGIAEQLSQYSIGYFYHPFPPLPQEGEEFVEFLNAATANLYPEES